LPWCAGGRRAALPLPVKEYEKDFTTPESLDQFRRLREAAENSFVVDADNPPGDRVESYRRAGLYVANACHVLFALSEGTRSGKPAGTWSGRSLSSQSRRRSRVGAHGAARRDGSERAGRSEGGAYTETLAFVMDKWVDAQTGYYRHTGKAHAHRAHRYRRFMEGTLFGGFIVAAALLMAESLISERLHADLKAIFEG
jgi:hypothetical protein